jgi:hypothetical protein
VLGQRWARPKTRSDESKDGLWCQAGPQKEKDRAGQSKRRRGGVELPAGPRAGTRPNRPKVKERGKE